MFCPSPLATDERSEGARGSRPASARWLGLFRLQAVEPFSELLHAGRLPRLVDNGELGVVGRAALQHLCEHLRQRRAQRVAHQRVARRHDHVLNTQPHRVTAARRGGDLLNTHPRA
eukprot:3601031-Pleurochrysis_carterae.AAC.1